MKRKSSLTKEELLARIAALEQRIDEFEQNEALRRRAEAALQESERRFRSLVEATSDWIWETDSERLYTYASPKIKDLLGYAPEDVIGKNPFDLMPKAEAERVALEFAEIEKARRPFAGLINVNLHKDGHEVILESSGVPLFDNKGNYLGYCGFDRNVTERRQSEEALRTSQIRLSEAMDLAHLAYWDADLATKELLFNDLFYSFCGTTAEREGGYRMQLGEYTKRFVHPEDWPGFSALILKSLDSRERETVLNHEHRLIRRDGEERHVLTHIKIIKNEAGATVRIYGANQDITERKRAEEERERLILELKEALAQVKTLSGLLPICACCKKIRNSKGIWEEMESYIRDRSEADFSHGICPECAAKLYPEYTKD